MIEINASVTRTQTSVTSYQASAQKSTLAYQKRGAVLSNLTNQQNQIVDEVGISTEAIQQLEEAQRLNQQLRAYNDYLNGNAQPNILVTLTANDNTPDVGIAGQSTKLSASITVAEVQQETLSISAKLNDEGNLTELSVSKETISAQYIQADITSEEFSFYARA